VDLSPSDVASRVMSSAAAPAAAFDVRFGSSLHTVYRSVAGPSSAIVVAPSPLGSELNATNLHDIRTEPEEVWQKDSSSPDFTPPPSCFSALLLVPPPPSPPSLLLPAASEVSSRGSEARDDSSQRTRGGGGGGGGSTGRYHSSASSSSTMYSDSFVDDDLTKLSGRHTAVPLDCGWVRRHYIHVYLQACLPASLPSFCDSAMGRPDVGQLVYIGPARPYSSSSRYCRWDLDLPQFVW
jgi:hypothetical protein